MKTLLAAGALFMLLPCSVGAQSEKSLPAQTKIDAGPKDWMGRPIAAATKPSNEQPATKPEGTCIPFARYEKYVRVEGDDWSGPHPDCVPDDSALKLLHDTLVAYRRLLHDYETLNRASLAYEKASEATIRALSAVPPAPIVFPPMQVYQPTTPEEMNCTSQKLGNSVYTHCN